MTRMQALRRQLAENEDGNPDWGRRQILLIALTGSDHIVHYLLTGVGAKMEESGDYMGSENIAKAAHLCKDGDSREGRRCLQILIETGEEILPDSKDDVVAFLLCGLLALEEEIESLKKEKGNG